jgi:hypothetical protein
MVLGLKNISFHLFKFIILYIYIYIFYAYICFGNIIVTTVIAALIHKQAITQKWRTGGNYCADMQLCIHKSCIYKRHYTSHPLNIKHQLFIQSLIMNCHPVRMHLPNQIYTIFVVLFHTHEYLHRISTYPSCGN